MSGITELAAVPSVFVTAFLITSIALLLKRRNATPNGKKYPPCLPTLPIVGSLPFVRGGLDVLPATLTTLGKKLGPVFAFYSGSSYIIVLTGKAVFDALLRKAETFASRPVFWSEINLVNVGRRGIGFTAYTETYRKNHKLFLSIMKEFGFGLTQESNIRIWNEVEHLIERTRKFHGHPFDPKKMIMHSMASVVINILFGDEFMKNEKRIDNIIINAQKWITSMDPVIDVLPIMRFVPHFAKKLRVSRKAQEDLVASLREAIKHSQTGKSSDSSFTRRFLEIQGPDCNHEDLVFVLRDACGGASDTLVHTLLWLLLEIANNPKIQARIQKEIDDFVPENRLPSYEDRFKLPYTEATMLENLRYHPLIPLGVLRTTIKETELHGFFIPKDCVILPILYSVHMDPEIWTDPENFRPERFLDEDNKIIGKENLVPFGVGKRSCIGEVLARQEVFVFLASLLQHFDIRPPEGEKQIRVEIDSALIVGPSPFNLRFIPRRKN